MASPFVPDLTGFAGGVQGFLSDRINQKLQDKALSGDQSALTKLSSRDPRAAQTIGGIFQQEDEKAKELAGMERLAMVGVARGYAQAENKKEYLASVSSLLKQRGMDRIASEVEADLSAYDENPQAVDNEYLTADTVFGSQEALKARKTVSFANGSVQNVLADGTAQVTDESGAVYRQGDAGYGEALKRAYQSEVDLAGAKSLAVSEGREGTEGQKIKIKEAKLKLAEGIKQAEASQRGKDIDTGAALSNISQLLQDDTYTKIYGKFESLIPDLLKSPDAVDAIALRDQVIGLLSLDSRQKLAGQGTITDGEAEELKRSATLLANPSISPALARKELQRVSEIFSTKSGAKERPKLIEVDY